MDDIVARLGNPAWAGFGTLHKNRTLLDLADAKAEIERLRAALLLIAQESRGCCFGKDADRMIDIARDAIKYTPPEDR
jgi:hypothetical protein